MVLLNNKMFGTLRDKFHSVQEGITASLRGFADPPRRPPADGEGSSVDYAAGANLLHKYQSEWSEIHQMSEANAGKAQALDELMGSLDRALGKQFTSVGQLTLALANIPQMLTAVQELMEDIGM